GDYVFYADVNPLNTKEITFLWKKEGEYKFFRYSLETELKFNHDSINSYASIAAIKSTNYKCWSWFLQCYDTCISAVRWRGFINYTDCEWDEFQEQVKVKATTFDNYSRILESFNEELNILSAGQSVDTIYAEIDQRFAIEWIVQYYSDDFYLTPNYYILNHVRKSGSGSVNWEATGLWWEWTPGQADKRKVFARLLLKVPFREGYTDCEEMLDADGYTARMWVYYQSNYEGQDLYCWMVHPINLPVWGNEIPGYTALLENNTFVIDTCVNGYPPAPIGHEDYYELYNGCIDDITVGDFPFSVYSALRTYDITEYNNSRYLDDVVEYFLGGHYTYYSQFFQSNTNPLLNPAIYGTANPLVNMLIAAKSNIIIAPEFISWHVENNLYDPATKAMMTFTDLLEMLKIIFNVEWYIDDVGRFRLEHEKYFANHLTYNILITPIPYDLTDSEYAQYMVGKYAYKFDKGKIPKYERFKWMEAANIDFKGADIWYDSSCVIKDPKENIKNWNADKVTTDLLHIRSSPEQISKDGFVLLVIREIDYGTVIRKWVRKEKGAMTGEYILNGHLSWANLHRNYFTWGRVLEEGYMNNIPVTFDSWEKVKLQNEFKIPLCCEVIDTKRPVKTIMGDGEIVEAKEEVSSGMVEFQLKYVI
ncbi:MAG: hypothetical protein NTZ85_01605, partial [Bacteroidia bacterium]|nr:hypothetical protein [Bacteroidia bacterium]